MNERWRGAIHIAYAGQMNQLLKGRKKGALQQLLECQCCSGTRRRCGAAENAAPVGFAYNLDARPSSQVTFVLLERAFFSICKSAVAFIVLAYDNKHGFSSKSSTVFIYTRAAHVDDVRFVIGTDQNFKGSVIKRSVRSLLSGASETQSRWIPVYSGMLNAGWILFGAFAREYL